MYSSTPFCGVTSSSERLTRLPAAEMDGRNIVITTALLCCCVAIACGQLTWYNVGNDTALCNDFTRAGYFVRRVSGSDKWVVFFESGGLCYSNETCNRRFFVSEVRERFARRGGRSFGPYGNFDPREAWRETVLASDNPRDSALDVVSPLMSSMQCFRDKQDYFPGGFEIEGRDILDENCDANPTFCEYNHVVVPYCSSDLWLGNEMDDTRVTTAATSECECFDYSCFQFNPSSENLQFTFRGKIIFESVFRDLMSGHGLGNASATEVVLAGSSAGGLGVINNVQWVYEELPPETDLRVIFDSSWFINFDGNIYREFDGTVSREQSEAQRQNAVALLDVIESHETCSNTALGYPCCISAHCVLTKTNENMEPYYPRNIPTFGIISLYDGLLLSPSLQRQLVVQDSGTRSDVGYTIDFIHTIGEYGGEMNSTVKTTASQVDNFSFYATQCFQHIYLATSTLWGPQGSSVFGSSSVELRQDIVSFRHSIQAGIWNSRELAANGSAGQRYTIQEALHTWYQSPNGTVEFRDTCTGPYCNLQCPETFTLGKLTSNSWSPSVKIIIVLVVLGIALVSVMLKGMFTVWLYLLERKQLLYLESLDTDVEEYETKLQFPDCPDDEAISVSCLDLQYCVTFRPKKTIDEKQDNITPRVLEYLTSEEEEAGESLHAHTHRAYGTLGQQKSSFLVELTKNGPTWFLSPKTSTKTQPDLEKTPSTCIFSDRKSTLSPPAALSPPTGGSSSETKKIGLSRVQKKGILKRLSVYFNPGELVGIMGPSGCGKTTLLDLLTGRRKTGIIKGEIFVNGIPVDEVRDWYIANTGYVLQLATPYYEELTVRENLTLAAQIKLPKTFSTREKFERVEQVMEVTGLLRLADTVVGGSTGAGLSGGQKRRLSVALQLLKLPSVIFLDEPTSGLDATSSFELLSHLNRLADSNRTVILTIHQPRLEIFHMFHRLVLLTDGKIAYHGVPEKAYEVFVNALHTRYLEQGLIFPELEDHNPADVIMDMLGNQKMRQLITDYYQSSEEPKLVKRAIQISRWKKRSLLEKRNSSITYAMFGAKRVGQRHGGTFDRLAALEARGAKRAAPSQLLYLPIIFFGYGVLLGTVYFQQTNPLLVVSGFCVYSVASALFMFPALYVYYQRALEVYGYEHADGVGRAHDLVIQSFIRFITMAFFPVIICAAVLYLLLVNVESYNFMVFGQVVIVNIALNQTWTALLIALICTLPAKAFRISPVIASVAGFTSGFFIPIKQIPWWYRWLSYINPNYYGFSASAFLLLSDFETDCQGTQFECYTSSGQYVLSQFNFDQINPYLHILILFMFTVFYLVLAVFSNWLRHNTICSKIKRLIVLSKRLSTTESTLIKVAGMEMEGKSFKLLLLSEPSKVVPMQAGSSQHLEIIQEAEEGEGEVGGVKEAPVSEGRAKAHWVTAVGKLEEQKESQTELEEVVEGDQGPKKAQRVRMHGVPEGPPEEEETPKKSLYLHEGETHHVWKPSHCTPQLASIVDEMMKMNRARKKTDTLRQRQRDLYHRVTATQAVLKEQNEELIKEDAIPEEPKKHISFKDASRCVTKNLKEQKSKQPNRDAAHFHDIVSRYLTDMKAKDEPVRVTDSSKVASGASLQGRQKQSQRVSPGLMSVQKWRELVREKRSQDALHEATPFQEGDAPPSSVEISRFIDGKVTANQRRAGTLTDLSPAVHQ